MDKYLKATANSVGITKDKLYKVEFEDDKHYHIDDDFGNYYYIPKWQVNTKYCDFETVD